MKMQETFYFDRTQYQHNISHKHFSYTTLAKEIYKKRANRLTSTVRTGSIAAVPFTGGLSGLSTIHSFRNISVESQKLTMLEVEWARRGQTMLPHRTITDNIIPITIAVGTSLLTIGIDAGLSSYVVDQFIDGTPVVFDLNGLLISEAFLQTPTEHGFGAALDQGVNSLGGWMTNRAVMDESKVAQQ